MMEKLDKDLRDDVLYIMESLADSLVTVKFYAFLEIINELADKGDQRAEDVIKTVHKFARAIRGAEGKHK